MTHFIHRASAVEARSSSTAFLLNMPRRRANTKKLLPEAAEVYELTTSSHIENLDVIRNFIVRLARKAGLNETAQLEIAIAVEEACVNAIKHGHHNDENMPLRLRIKIDRQKLTALVKDQGRGFDPEQRVGQNPQELLAKPKSNGRGILMMEMFMDEVHFEIGHGKGTRVWLVKYLTPPQQKNLH